jgi:hypothetical protein
MFHVAVGSFSTELGCPRHVRFPPVSDHGHAGCLKRAKRGHRSVSLFAVVVAELLEQHHRLVCQHAAGDRDWSKWRLGCDLGA